MLLRPRSSAVRQAALRAATRSGGVGSTVNTVGYYCGRIGEGILGEPQNSLTNLAFIAAALWAFGQWRQGENRDPLILAAVLAGGAIGLGSVIFHSHPTPLTLQIDLWPIQIFGLGVIFLVAQRGFGLGLWGAGLAVLGFAAIRQLWVALLHPGLLGGGITHVPALVVLLGSGVILWRRGHPLGRALVGAAGLYVLALNARAADLMICDAFPWGTHWLWHLLTAGVVATLLHGLVRHGKARDDLHRY